MQIINDNTLKGLGMDNPVSHLSLSAFPLYAKDFSKAGYVLLESALENRTAEVEETSNEGHVPELLVDNRNDCPLFIMDGETLTGEKLKQNRIASISTLLPGMKKSILSVLCSERGRWSRTNREFASRESSLYASARSAKMNKMQENMRATGTDGMHASADQEQVWSQINTKLSSFDINSESESMQDLYQQNEKRMQSYLDSMSMPDNAQGVVFAIAGSIKGFELFSCPQTFHALYPKLLKSYVMDAMEQEDIQFTKPQIKDARKLLEDTDSCVAKQCKAQGVGKLFIINSSQLQATVLMLDGVIVHFTCFSKNMQGEL